MVEFKDVVCVILAGGRGKRMMSTACHKVCFPIAGRPAIVRAIDTYKRAGLRRFLVVVGQMGEQVAATIAAEHPEVSFVYQVEPRGTGHAALVAVEALAAQNFAGAVLITMGDKVTQASVVRRLLDQFAGDGPDALLSTLPKLAESTAGRVLTDASGAVLGIVEVPDIRRARERGATLVVGGQSLSADEVEARGTSVNASLYLFRFGMLHEALRHLSPSNAQGELYLTDTAEYISRRGRVTTMLVDEPTDLMAYNTPAELLAIEDVVYAREAAHRVVAEPEKRHLTPRVLKSARHWLEILEGAGPALQGQLRAIYGADASLTEERRAALLRLVRAFAGQYGLERSLVICRAPGRINLMGRHVDHRGGCVNVMAISKDVLLAAGPREDDLVRLRNLDVTHFPNREFRIYDLLGEATWSDWMNFLATATARRVLNAAPGDWSHYVRAPLLRLQCARRHVRLNGMDCMVCGDIPMGAGLSSSSALVVAFAEAAVALNGLNVEMRDFIDLCGEGEWFVGSRGGSADHAAIRTGQVGHVTRIGFFPFEVLGEVPFPAPLRIVIAHSGSQAVKSAGARDVFNQRIACYEFAQMLLRMRWPAAAGMRHLRDLTPDRLKVEAADLYRAIALLPERPSRTALRALLADGDQEHVARILATHRGQGGYDLRGVALFGLAECMRSAAFAELLGAGDLARIGQFMRASHEGDRRVRFDAEGRSRRVAVRLDDRSLAALATRSADLSLQPGRYACSTAAIDELVDLASACKGVVGAQLAGAGLGGCMMILVEAQHLDGLRRRLQTRFYARHGIEPCIEVCSPVAGAGLVGVDD